MLCVPLHLLLIRPVHKAVICNVLRLSTWCSFVESPDPVDRNISRTRRADIASDRCPAVLMNNAPRPMVKSICRLFSCRPGEFSEIVDLLNHSDQCQVKLCLSAVNMSKCDMCFCSLVRPRVELGH